MSKILFANAKTHKKLDKHMIVVLALLSCLLLIFFYYTAINLPINSPDEYFYLTSAHRVYLGDSLLIDEWHPTQFSSFVLYPFIWLFIRLTGSTVGILLFMRLIFFCFQFAISLAIYFKLRYKSYLCAFFSMVLFALYIVECIPQLSYNTQGLMFTEVVALLLLTTSKRGFWRCYFAGIFTALMVTAQPFDAIVYFVYCLLVFAYWIYKKKKAPKKGLELYFSPKLWLYLTLGIFTVFSVFMMYVLKNANLLQIIAAIPNIFTDPEHGVAFFSTDGTMFNHMALIRELYYCNRPFFWLSILIPLFFAYGKNKTNHKDYLALICGILYMIYTIIWVVDSYSNNINIILLRSFPMFVFAIEAYILTENKNKKLLLWWLLGSIYIIFCASDCIEFSGGAGFAISNVACMIMIFDLLHETYDKSSSSNVENNKQTINGTKTFYSLKNRFIPIFLSVVVVTGISVEIATGISIPFNGDKIMDVWYQLGEDSEEFAKSDKGPLSGIAMPESQIKRYDAILQDLDYIKSNCSGRVLIAELIPWCYLYIERPYGTFSAWERTVSNENKVFDKYLKYFESTSNYPDCVYITYEGFHFRKLIDGEEAMKFFTETFDCTVERGTYGYILFVNK